MATHYSILACKMPWMEEPGRLQSMGLQRVSCNGATSVRPSFCSSVKPCLKAITFTNIIEKISRTKRQPVSIARYTELWENYENMSSNRISTIHLFKNIIEVPRWWCNVKESACQCRRQKRHGFNLWVRKIPLVGGIDNPLQYSCLKNFRDRWAWWSTFTQSWRVRYNWTTGHARMCCI